MAQLTVRSSEQLVEHLLFSFVEWLVKALVRHLNGGLYVLKDLSMPSQSQLSALLIVFFLAVYVLAMEACSYVVKYRFAPLLRND